MPLGRDHLDQARRNRTLAETLARNSDDPTSRQWAVVAGFYCALHVMEARLSDFGNHSKDHGDRTRLLALHKRNIPRDVFIAYKELKEWSEQVRYDTRSVTVEEVQNRLLDDLLRRVTVLVHF